MAHRRDMSTLMSALPKTVALIDNITKMWMNGWLPVTGRLLELHDATCIYHTSTLSRVKSNITRKPLQSIIDY